MASQSTPPFPWIRLPLELKLMVLEELWQLGPTAGKNSFTCWSTVSMDWYKIFTSRLWRAIKLRSDMPFDIKCFKAFTTYSKKVWVRKISLHVSLQEYTCQQCGHEESAETKTDNNKIFSDSLLSLFNVLSSWPGQVQGPEADVMLELSASSPSDPMHRQTSFRDHERQVIAQSPGHSRLNAKKRLLGQLLELRLDRSGLPEVTVIRTLSISQKCLRSLSSYSLRNIFSKLPSLRDVNYEPWRGVDEEAQRQREYANASLFRYATRFTSLRTLTLWEAQSRRLHENTLYSKTSNKELTSEATIASFKLEALAISHATDATSFLRCFHDAASKIWSLGISSRSTLKYIVLTCQTQVLTANPAKVDQVLLAAAKAAFYMPCLQAMEVWAPGIHEGFFFRYEIIEGIGLLTVGATWRVKPRDPAIFITWEPAARRHSVARFEFDIKLIKTDDLRVPTSILKFLKFGHKLRE